MAIRPDLGLSNGREVSLWSVSQASWLIFGFEGSLEGFVRVVGAEEIGVADEKAFLVVVGVNEPAGDAVGAVATDFSGAGIEDIDALHLHAQPTIRLRQELNVRFAEDDEQVSLAGVLEILGHMQVGVHPSFEHEDAAQLAELRGVSFVVEGACYQHIESGIAGLTSTGDKIGALHGAELGADEDGGPLLRFAFAVAAFRAD